MKKKLVARGLSVQENKDGHWLVFEVNGKHALINIENKLNGTRIVRDTVIQWCDSQLDEKLQE